MRIDYSISSKSQNLCYLDVNFRFAFRHLVLGLSQELNLDLLDRVKHVALAALEMIPGIGHVTAWADKSLNGKVVILKVDSSNPYQMGYEQGITFRKEIRTLYSFVMKRNKEKEAAHLKKSLTEARKLEKQIPSEIIDEMKGLADGAGVSYEDVLCVHTFLDIYPGTFGCTAAGLVQADGKLTKKAIAANHTSVESHPHEDSLRRYKALDNHAYTTETTSFQDALQQAGNNHTVQSILFDTQSKSIHMSSAWSSAASKIFHPVKGQELWTNPSAYNDKKKVTLIRNLDWPWPVLGSETILVVRNAKPGQQETVLVTWPGFIGALSGMNASGLALAACSQGTISTMGIPTTLLLRKALEQKGSAKEASAFINDGNPASSMNVVVADADDVTAIELHKQATAQKNLKKELNHTFQSELLKEFGCSIKNLFHVVHNRKQWDKKKPPSGKIIEI